MALVKRVYVARRKVCVFYKLLVGFFLHPLAQFGPFICILNDETTQKWETFSNKPFQFNSAYTSSSTLGCLGINYRSSKRVDCDG